MNMIVTNPVSATPNGTTRPQVRIVIVGHVDHGKSTLIGRLLYEAKSLFEDQLASLEAESRKYGTLGGDLDYSLLLDGLAAGREQKIIQLRFGLTDGHPRTLEEVGREFGVTRARIRQIESKTLAKLRHPTRSQRLRDYLEEA